MSGQLALASEVLLPSLSMRKECAADGAAPRVKRHRKAKMRYLFESAKPPVKSRRLKVTQERRYREGRRPQSIGARPLAHLEINAIDTELWLQETYAFRPKIWRDCMPLHCPWCNTETRMAMVPAESEEHQDGFACPRCEKLVAFLEERDGTPHWVRRRAGQPLARNYAAYQRALNHAGACGWVSCRHGVYLDADEDTGMIKVNHPGPASNVADLGDNIDHLRVTCTLAEGQRLEDAKDSATLEEIGVILNITQERTNQIFKDGNEQLQYALEEFRTD